MKCYDYDDIEAQLWHNTLHGLFDVEFETRMILAERLPKIGDRVTTPNGEIGTVDHEFNDGSRSYDWWVRIDFQAQGKEYSTFEPYKNCELKKL